MKKRISSSLLLMMALLASLTGQAQTPSAQPQPQQQREAQGDDDVVRITTNLVQIDAVVLDRDGRQVKDLGPQDFEILEDARPQKVTNFSYISTEGAGGATVVKSAPVSASVAPVPPARIRPGQARRTLALVVDDLGLSFETAAYVRQYLKNFVEQQMQPGDLVAVVRTSAGVGAFQQFSSDKRQVLQAIERVRYYPGQRGATGSFEQRERDPSAPSADKNRATGDESKSERRGDEAIEEYRENLFAVGTLGALNYVVRGMRQIPGRKSVVLISENLRIFNRARRDAPVLEYLRRLADLANRASVSIYNFNAHELKPSSLSDEESIVTPTILGVGPGSAGGSGPQYNTMQSQFESQALRNERALGDARAEYYESQAGLRYLAQQTGGASAFSLDRVLEDQKGYYLIGYRPEDATFDPQTGGRRFHKITLRLKRPGLRVRNRIGFYSISEEETHPPAPITREGQLISAATSPFASGDMRLRLTSLFGNDQQTGSFVRSLLYIDPRDLSFREEPDGSRTAQLDVLALTFGESGKAVDEVNRIETIRKSPDEYRKLMQTGLLYTIKVPIRQAGAYQLRVAVRDASTQRTGSANEFIEVPDMNRGYLALSGIALSGRNPSQARKEAVSTAMTPSAYSPAGSDAAAPAEDFDPQANPAVRRLRPGMELRYDYLIYNAQLDPATNRPQLMVQTRLFREGRMLYEGRPAPFETSQQADLKHLLAGGSIKLSAAAPPGDYVLQLIVTDALAKDKYRTATQWIDFELAGN